MRVVPVSESMLCDLIGLPLEARIIGATFEGGPSPRESTVYLLVSGDDEPIKVETARNVQAKGTA